VTAFPFGRRTLLGAASLLSMPHPGRAQEAGFVTRLDDTVAAGLARAVLIRWGDRVDFDAPPFAPTNPTVESAQAQFGWDGRVVALVQPPAVADGVPRAVLVVTHPTVDAALAFPGGRDRPEVALAMQGASVLNLGRQGAGWILADGGFQMRRLHGRTLCRITGPARAALGDGVQGVVGPRGGSATPWGTVLLGENAEGWLPRLRGGRAEAYGWVVEFDPLDPQSVPAKRTALGRLAHGDVAAAVTADGRAVVYRTDRRAGGHLLRFVSAGQAGPDALDEGETQVALFEGGTMRWIAMPDPGAASGIGTPLDGPAGLSVPAGAPRLFLAIRGGAGRIFEITPAGRDHGAATATVRGWLDGRASPPLPDPNARARSAPAPWPDAPEALHADAQGRLFIGTDREGRLAALPDALYLSDAPGRAVPLYGAPRGAAVGGAAITPDRTAILAMVRHPGAGPGANWASPGTTWPEFAPGMPPRSTLIVLSRQDGRPV